MKNLLLTFTIILFSSFSLGSEKNITLSLGETHRIPLRGSPSVWIQNRTVLKADGMGSLLVLKGQSEGRTTLRIGSDVYEIQVLHPIKTSSYEEFKSYLTSFVGLSADLQDADLQVKGTLYRLQDWVKIADFARHRRLSYKMRADISKDLQGQVQNYFEERLREAKLPPQTVIFPSSPEVRIKASELSGKKYETLFAPFGVEVIRDEASLEIAPTVKVEITVAEVKKRLSRKWGIQWPSSYAATVLPDGTWTHDGMKLQLDGDEDSGDAKILASPNILCRSGHEAEFLAGGEFPIKVLGYRSESVMWRKYGISLKVKPKADAAGRISLSIETEIASLDKATTADNIPGLRINKVSSHFDITKPQTIALSGLIKNEDGESSKGLPWLSKVPVLGSLFSSKDFLEDRSELVIFVRPTILKEDVEDTPLAHLKGGVR